FPLRRPPTSGFWSKYPLVAYLPAHDRLLGREPHLSYGPLRRGSGRSRTRWRELEGRGGGGRGNRGAERGGQEHAASRTARVRSSEFGGGECRRPLQPPPVRRALRDRLRTRAGRDPTALDRTRRPPRI